MRPLISTILIIIIFLLCSKTIKNYKLESSENFCDYFKSTSQLQKLNFVPDDHNKININELVKVDKPSNDILYVGGFNSSERNYLFGQFSISKTRLGLVCFNQTRECDHDQSFLSLHIIDNCKKARESLILSLSDDDGGILYEISSSLNKAMDTLTIKRETTSEWVVGTDSKVDTLFTDIYILNLKSENLDTITKKTFYKKIKYN